MKISLLQANSLRIPLASNSVDLVCTSPPYFGQRDYNEKDQLGLESSPKQYVENTLIWAAEVWRVLKDTGVFFLNIGDSYNGSGGAGGDYNKGGLKEGQPKYPGRNIHSLKNLDLIGIPWMVAFALRDQGWYLRRENIWHKTNSMPESVKGWRWERHKIKVTNRGRGTEEYRRVTGQQDHDKDGNFKPDAIWEECPGCKKCEENDGLVLRKGSGRTTTAHEYIFMFTKTANYYYDDIAIAEKSVDAESFTGRRKRNAAQINSTDPNNYKFHGSINNDGKLRHGQVYPTRNKRSVWKMSTSGYSGSHFAVFPMELPEICIKAGSSEYGNCKICGEPYARVIDHQNMKINRSKRTHNMGRTRSSGTMISPALSKTIDWRSTCEHDAGVVPAIVLDPFGGRGTTAMVANRLGRHGISLDLSEHYLQLSKSYTSIKALEEWERGIQVEENDFDGLPMFENQG